MASRWMLSERGRQAAGIAGLTGGLIGALVGLLPHTHLLEQYKRIVQAYKEGRPMDLDPVVQKRAEEVLQLVDLGEKEKKSVRFFPVPILDTFFAGSTTGSHGAVIGLPLTFSYTRKEDVQTKSLLVHGYKEADWETKEGEALKKSLVLSEKAQRFVIAREIYWADTYYVQLQTAALSFSVFNCYIMGRLANDKLHLLVRTPRALRVGLYGIIVALNATVYICFKDAMSQLWDKRADREAAALGRDYVEGGIEYYEKLLQRNRALRELLGDEGRKCYTSKGNINRILRTDHIPITHRLDVLKNQLQVDSKEADSMSEFSA
ncbi:transmembrane protein 177 [Dermacentor albipictus]|uniref:transmembrane protein 177 n=1 Tax=Dermacentor albipictus TaxID=60249 RepID=UPI0031FCE67F